jgi:hypothetical protein
MARQSAAAAMEIVGVVANSRTDDLPDSRARALSLALAGGSVLEGSGGSHDGPILGCS